MTVNVLLPTELTTESYTWVEPDGTEHVLNLATGYPPAQGRTGLFTQPISYTDERVPGQQGTALREVIVGARDIDFPMWILGDTEAQVRGRLRDLARWIGITNKNAPGTLKTTAPDGSIRTITAYGHVEAAEGENERYRWPPAQAAVMILRCPDPYFYAESSSTQAFTLETGGYPFFLFQFPFRVPSSTVLGTVNIENEGDVEAWPIWTITGPGQVPVIRNRDTGEMIGINLQLEPGDQVIIDTRPGHKAVTDGQGANLFGDMLQNSSLWSLPAGFSVIQAEMSGSSSASSISGSWRSRYWMP